MKWNSILLLTLLFLACTNEENEIDDNNESKPEDIYIPAEQVIVRHLESDLQIPATEDYSYKIFSEELNGDDSLDYVVTVNRLSYAIEDAIKDDNLANRAQMGYVGMHNYIFFMDGASKKITSAIPVGSSPHRELEVDFANIFSDMYKDFTVDFRIRNACFRKFFTVINNVPRQTFETMIFDGLGTDSTEAYSVSFENGTYSLASDIVIYKALLEDMQFDDPVAIYKADPKITATEKIERRWYFHEGQKKYFTRKDEDPN
jgi:hypothetical protein